MEQADKGVEGRKIGRRKELVRKKSTLIKARKES